MKNWLFCFNIVFSSQLSVFGRRLSVSVVDEVRFCWKGGRMEGLNEARFLLKNTDVNTY